MSQLRERLSRIERIIDGACATRGHGLSEISRPADTIPPAISTWEDLEDWVSGLRYDLDLGRMWSALPREIQDAVLEEGASMAAPRGFVSIPSSVRVVPWLIDKPEVEGIVSRFGGSLWNLASGDEREIARLVKEAGPLLRETMNKVGALIRKNLEDLAWAALGSLRGPITGLIGVWSDGVGYFEGVVEAVKSDVAAIFARQAVKAISEIDEDAGARAVAWLEDAIIDAAENNDDLVDATDLIHRLSGPDFARAFSEALAKSTNQLVVSPEQAVDELGAAFRKPDRWASDVAEAVSYGLV